MPLIHCPACNHEVSSASATCLHCGHPIASRSFTGIAMRTVKLVLTLIVLGVVFMVAYGGCYDMGRDI